MTPIMFRLFNDPFTDFRIIHAIILRIMKEKANDLIPVLASVLFGSYTLIVITASSSLSSVTSRRRRPAAPHGWKKKKTSWRHVELGTYLPPVISELADLKMVLLQQTGKKLLRGSFAVTIYTNIWESGVSCNGGKL